MLFLPKVANRRCGLGGKVGEVETLCLLGYALPELRPRTVVSRRGAPRRPRMRRDKTLCLTDARDQEKKDGARERDGGSFF
jgi:hypothetical protein